MYGRGSGNEGTGIGILIATIFFVIHFIRRQILQARNKNGNCAKCNNTISGSNSVCIAASYQKYYYCIPCSKLVKKNDRIFFILSMLIVIILLWIIYVYTKNP